MEFDTIKDEIIALGDKGVKYAQSLDKSLEAEIFVTVSPFSQVELRTGMVEASGGVSAGVGARLLKEKRLGFGASSGYNISSVESAVDEAYSVVKAISHEGSIEGFVDPKPLGKEGDLCEDYLETTPADLIRDAETLSNEAQAVDSRIVSVEGYVESSWGAIAIVNSAGVAAATRNTVGVIYAEAIAVEGEKRKSAYSIKVSRSELLNPEGLGTKGGEKVIKLLTSKPLKASEKLPTLWDPHTTGSFLTAALGNSVNGRSVVEGRSAFADKIGEQIGIKNLSIIDDGQLPEGIKTGSIDGEGSPRQTTPIIESGILKSFLFDMDYGNRFGTSSTGNANRGGLTPHESSPNISPTTLTVENGLKSSEDLVAEIDRGIFLQDFLMGMLHANQISGDFSIVSPNAFLIEKGEVIRAVEPVTVAGNMYQAFNQILEIGSDRIMTPGGVYTPSFVFDDFSISG